MGGWGGGEGGGGRGAGVERGRGAGVEFFACDKGCTLKTGTPVGTVSAERPMK